MFLMVFFRQKNEVRKYWEPRGLARHNLTYKRERSPHVINIQVRPKPNVSAHFDFIKLFCYVENLEYFQLFRIWGSLEDCRKIIFVKYLYCDSIFGYLLELVINRETDLAFPL